MYWLGVAWELQLPYSINDGLVNISHDLAHGFRLEFFATGLTDDCYCVEREGNGDVDRHGALSMTISRGLAEVAMTVSGKEMKRMRVASYTRG